MKVGCARLECQKQTEEKDKLKNNDRLNVRAPSVAEQVGQEEAQEQGRSRAHTSALSRAHTAARHG